MAKLRFQFNKEDEGLEKLTGTVSFPSDFKTGQLETISVGGLGEWRNVNADTVHISENFIRLFLTPKRKAKLTASKKVVWIGLKAKTDLMLSYKVRKMGTKAIVKVLTDFFQAVTKNAKVKIEVDNNTEL
jgi:hypothetical protein